MTRTDGNWARCGRAIRVLSQRKKVFTEINVVNYVHDHELPGATAEEIGQLRYTANQVLSSVYRTGQIARYGPVAVTLAGVEHLDHARFAGVIVHSGKEHGPGYWDTPNGRIPRLFKHDDPVASPRGGRREGANRDDSRPWIEQGITARILGPEQVILLEDVISARRAEIAALRAEMRTRDALIASLEATLQDRDNEIARLRASLDGSSVSARR